MKKVFLVFLPFYFAAQFASADVKKADETLVKTVGAQAASQITFEPGRATLTSAEISALNDLVANARNNNEKIDEVKVFAWGDKVYPANAGNVASRQDKKVADERIKSIKNYLKKELKVRDIETFNMTRQPREFADLVHAAGSRVRDLAPNGTSANPANGAAPITAQNVSEFERGNPSEALILIYKKQ
jgi:hypothetical protein